MSDEAARLTGSAEPCRQALSRWENEGGAPPLAIGQSIPDARKKAAPDLKNAELVQLQVRVIALENIIIALLAKASTDQLELVSENAEYILPRPGSTQHPLTLEAAKQMLNLVERAERVSDNFARTGCNTIRKGTIMEE